MRRQRSLSEARNRSDPARTRAARALATRRPFLIIRNSGLIRNLEVGCKTIARFRVRRALPWNDGMKTGVLRVNPRELAMAADEARSRLGRGLASLIGDVGGEAAHV